MHIVTGAPGSGKSALITRLTRDRPDWLGLVNAVSGAAANNLRSLIAGCPCCTGRVVLQVSLVRALRESGARRAFVELANPAHAANFAKLLQESPFSLSVRVAPALILPGDQAIDAAGIVIR